VVVGFGASRVSLYLILPLAGKGLGNAVALEVGYDLFDRGRGLPGQVLADSVALAGRALFVSHWTRGS
jgi:hypothetical protein